MFVGAILFLIILFPKSFGKHVVADIYKGILEGLKK